MPATITVEEIKAKYPKPRTAHVTGARVSPMSSSCPPAYCVGGAFVAFSQDVVMLEDSFPNYQVLSNELALANSDLQPNRAFEFAAQITNQNDKGRFSRAWRCLDLALKYAKP